MNYHFLYQTIKKTLVLKYRRAYLGFIWTLLEPLLMMLVLTLIFQDLFGNDDPFFPIYVLCGRLIFSFFSISSRQSIVSIKQNIGIIKSFSIREFTFPIATCISNFTVFLISLLDLLLVMLIYKMPITLNIIFVFFPLLILFLFTLGTTLIISSVVIKFRDIEYFWEALLMLIMFSSAIFYDTSKLEGKAVFLVFKFNPMYGLIKIFRASIYSNDYDVFYAVYTTIVAFLLFAIGLIIYKKMHKKFILLL